MALANRVSEAQLDQLDLRVILVQQDNKETLVHLEELVPPVELVPLAETEPPELLVSEVQLDHQDPADQ